jgi:hypothetical protein
MRAPFTDDTSLPQNLGHRGGRNEMATPPTPAEIEAATAAMRATWPPERLLDYSGRRPAAVQVMPDPMLCGR